MTTVSIDTRSTEAKKMLGFLKATRYAWVIEEYSPYDETLAAMKEVEDGNVNLFGSVHEMMSKMKKKSRV